MKPVFDENGLATVPGDMRCFYYDAVTSEYTGWSDEYINTGVSMPACSTGIDPGEYIPGKVAVFTGKGWSHEEDHRGKTVYSTTDGMPHTIDYIGPINNGYTNIAPSDPFQKWDGKKWVSDPNAKYAADVEVADKQKAILLVKAKEKISFWTTELQLGIISDEDKTSLIAWIWYIKALQEVDTSKAPDITWPAKPAER